MHLETDHKRDRDCRVDIRLRLNLTEMARVAFHLETEAGAYSCHMTTVNSTVVNVAFACLPPPKFSTVTCVQRTNWSTFYCHSGVVSPGGSACGCRLFGQLLFDAVSSYSCCLAFIQPSKMLSAAPKQAQS